MKKRLLSVLVVLAMLLTMAPTAALADIVIGTMTVSYVQIDGLDLPIVGATPDRAAELPSGAGYTIGAPAAYSDSFIDGIAWYDETAGAYMAADDVFLAGHSYFPVIGLTANSGYAFITASALSGTTNLCETVNFGGFQNESESKYICVNLGTLTQPWSMQALHKNTITTTNCTAYNAAGEIITEAVEGEVVTIKAHSPSGFTQAFNGWLAEPSSLGITQDGYGIMHFTMPAEPVSITGSYQDIIRSSLWAGLDKCYVGQEPDFTASTVNGNIIYSGYSFFTPAGYEQSCYNGVTWYDQTAQYTMTPGDVFQEGHSYEVSVYVAAEAGYAFCDAQDMAAHISCAESSTASPLYTSGYSADKYLILTSAPITPISSNSLYLENCSAYDSAGNAITEALPGAQITLVADEPEFGWEFASWSLSSTEIDIEDAYSSTTTMIMPNASITVSANYTEAAAVPVDKLYLDLYGYYIGASADCLQLAISGGAEFVTNTVTNLDYIMLEYDTTNPDTPSSVRFDGTVARSTQYWIMIRVAPEFGYTLEGLEQANILTSFSTDVYLGAATADAAIIYIKLPTAYKGLTQGTITVNNGTAYLNHTAVTSAPSSMRIRIEADETSTDQTFYRWQVVSGGVELENPYDPVTYFTMGTAAVELEPVYYSYIDYIEVEISAPVAGTTPSYYKSILTENVMSDSTGDSYSRNGMIWYDVDTEEILDPNTAVFEVGHSYGVQIQLMTEPGAYFTLDETGYPAVTGCVNGVTDGVYVDQYTQSPQTQVMLQTSFYIAEDAEVAAPVSEVSITELEMPIAGELFGYNFSYDYLDDICGNVDSDDADTLNGITWIDITDPNNPVSMTPGVSLAEEGHMYRVEILMSTTNSKIFALDESGLPSAIEGSINGESCDVALAGGAEPTRTIKLVYSVYAQEKFSLTVVGGLALVNGNYVAEADILPGTEIMLLPETSEDQVFSYWYVEVEGVHRLVYEANLIFDMPAGDTIVQAGYTFPHTHNTEPVEEKMSTCTENGWLRHYYCADCGRYSLDGTYTDYVDYTAHIELPLADHYVGAVEYSEEGHYGVCGYGCGLILTDVIPHEIVMHHDDLQHWGSCECGYEDTSLRAEHTWPSGGCGEVHCDCGATTILAHDYADGICANCLQSLAEAIDLNDDGKVTAFDAQYLTEANAGLRELTEAQKIALGNLCAQDIINYILGRFDGA